MILTYGDIICDILVRATGPLAYGSDVTGAVSFSGGGSAANFAAWAGSIGGNVTFIGKIGKDVPGDFLSIDLQRWGVKCHLLSSEQQRTGTIVVLIDENGERTMVTDRAVNLTFTPGDLNSNWFTGASHLHLTGYSLFGAEQLVKTASHALQLAHDQGLTVSVDPSSYALLADFGVEQFIQLTAGSDWIFPNLDEGRTLSGLSQPEDIVEVLLQYYHNVALTLGADGCLLANSEFVIHVESDNVPVVDTTGAGDAFAAAFMVALLAGKSLPEAGAYANSIARDCITKLGGRPPILK